MSSLFQEIKHGEWIILKLGAMQPLKKYKFLQEQVFEGFWPFSRFQSPANVLLLLLVYFIWGFCLYLIYNIPLSFMIAGSCGAFGLFLWTIGIFRYANALRNVKIERINKVNQKFLIGFLENLFHPSSIVLGVFIFTAVLTYLFTSPSLGTDNFLTELRSAMNVESLPPLLMLFIFLLIFDLCYRLGLSLYLILTQIKRNLILSHYLNTPLLKSHFSPIDIRNLERSDRIHFVSICGGFTLIPLGLLDPIILIVLLIYISTTFILSTAVLIHLRFMYLRAIPDGIMKLIRSAKFAQVGTIRSGKKPHLTPTLFIFNGRNFFIATSNRSQKVKNLSNFNKIAIFIDSQNQRDFTKNVGLLTIGHARIYGHNIRTGIGYFLILGFRMIRTYLLFQLKYPHYINEYLRGTKDLPRAWQVFPIISRTIIEIIPEEFYLSKASRSELIKF
ncbi:hypothetical protein CEE45_06345 [Candidatus Heimdallarchaeota archaeon B3_Heim]|nr:MAG: hypothetical protein CEE45_06345 [Candidatus Heimdallarchaeota archaeon B3_Heim]